MPDAVRLALADEDDPDIGEADPELLPWVRLMGELVPKVTEVIIGTVLEREDDRAARFVAAMLYMIECVARRYHDETATPVLAIAAGMLELETAVRTIELDELARQAAAAISPPVPIPAVLAEWVIEDLHLPLWHTLVQLSETTPTQDHPLLRERIRVEVERAFELPDADPSQVIACYARWATERGWTVEHERSAAFDTTTTTLKAPLVVNRERVSVDVERRAGTLTINVKLTRPSSVESMLEQLDALRASMK
jgi:hypothetical protein